MDATAPWPIFVIFGFWTFYLEYSLYYHSLPFYLFSDFENVILSSLYYRSPLEKLCSLPVHCTDSKSFQIILLPENQLC